VIVELLDALQDPSAYPHPVPEPVEVRQTHISVVFLAGDRAYKVKKPVTFGFVDYSTLQRRHAFCEAEDRLNRRLAPNVYLGVVPIVRDATGRLRVDAPGPPVEWAVVMRRLPYAATLAAAVERDAPILDPLRELADRLATFHAQATPAAAGTPFGRAPLVQHACLDNFDALAAASRAGWLDAARVERLRAAVLGVWERCAPAIDARADAGRIRECHGDLRLDHVYVFPHAAPPDDLCVIDGIEFNDAFRIIDPVADVAFLAMDLAVRGRTADAQAFLDRWFLTSGDPDGRAVLPIYLAYRATVRAKVESLRAEAAEVPADARDRSRARTVQHLDYTERICAASVAP